MVACCLTTCVLLCGIPADDATAAQMLQDLGLKRKGAVWVLQNEIDFSRRMSRLRKARTTMIQAQAKQDDLNRREQNNWALKERLIDERQKLSGRLATARDVRQHNKLAARINQITDQLELIDMANQDPERARIDDQLRTARRAYFEALATLHDLAAATRRGYTRLAADPAVTEAIAELNRAGRRPCRLGPRKTFGRAITQLEAFEGAVESTAIPMTSRMNSHWVEVEFNNKFKQELIFDTGADFVCLPSAMAARMGIIPDHDSPIFLIGMASGGTVEGRAVFLESLSVGGFAVQQVTCVIWPPEMTDAPPLLGGSYLRHFIYQIDPAADTLTLSRINTGK